MLTVYWLTGCGAALAGAAAVPARTPVARIAPARRRVKRLNELMADILLNSRPRRGCGRYAQSRPPRDPGPRGPRLTKLHCTFLQLHAGPTRLPEATKRGGP